MKTTAQELYEALKKYGTDIKIYVHDHDRVWGEAVLEISEELNISEDPIALFLHLKATPKVAVK